MNRVLRGLKLATFCGAAVFSSAPTLAQETQPGDPCLPAQTNQIKRSGGPELGGNLYEMRCDGSAWRILLSAVGGSNIGIGTDAPSQSALLELQSSDKGFLPPRLTETQRNAITGPSAGLIIFNTSQSKLEVFDGGSWQSLADGSGGGGGGTVPSGENLVVAYRSGDFSITNSQASHLFLVDSAALASLPALSSVAEGFRIYIKRTGFGNVTVAAASGDDIEGAPSMSIGFQGGLLEMVATASRWELLRAGTAGGGGDPSACPAGSVSYGTGQIGVSEFTITQAMVDHCIFSFEVKGAGGGSSAGGGSGGGIAFNWTPTDVGKLGIFVGEGGFYSTSGAAGGLGGGGGGDAGGGGGASAVRFFETDNAGSEIAGSSVVLAIAGGGGGPGPSTSNERGGQGGSIGAGFNGQGIYPGGGAPGNGSGGTRGTSGSRYGGSGGSAGNNGGLSSYQSAPAALGVSAFNIGGGGAGYGNNGGGGGGGYGGGGGGYDAGGGGGAGFLLSDVSISNGTSITGGAPGAQAGFKGEDGSVTIIITGR